MPRVKKTHLIFIVIFVFLSWNVLTYLMLMSKQLDKPKDGLDLGSRLTRLKERVSDQRSQNERLINVLKDLKQEADEVTKKKLQQRPVLPVLMIACDRTTVSRSLDQLLKYRTEPERFPIIVSQDCGDQATANVIRGYVRENKVKLIQHPDLSNINLPWPQRKFLGYYKIARHYKWALNQIFRVFNYTSVIIVEDDLDVSPDFFEYFSATHHLLETDPMLWCVSAWNDNGKGNLVSDEAELLYRTDFFPGLGWMILKKVWDELEPKWPESFWDDWMRHPEQRKGRECIRPEISRTSTFGKKGVSKGLFFDKFLKFILLNSKFVPFSTMDLSYLQNSRYEKEYLDKVYSTMQVSVGDVLARRLQDKPALRVQYVTKDDFKSSAKALGIMDDFKAGIPRTAYRGIVSFMFGKQRVYLAPPRSWQGYDLKWS